MILEVNPCSALIDYVEGGTSYIARVRSGWKKFRELIPLVTVREFSLHMTTFYI